MLTEQMTAAEVFDKYRSDIEKLIAYLPWLEEKSGKSKVSDIYNGDGLDEHSISFPVYDGTLLRFVKDAENTQFMDRNYVYVISRNRLKSAEEEEELKRWNPPKSEFSRLKHQFHLQICLDMLQN